MQNRLFIVLIIAGLIFSSGSLFARDNKMEFGFGLQLGYFYPELSDHVGDGFYMESTNKAIYGLNATFGFTTHFWGQLLAEYYPGEMEYDIRTSFSEVTFPNGQRIVTDYVLNFDAEADLTTMPISLNIGYSFIKDGKLDPYVSLGPTWYTVDVDSVTAKGKKYAIGESSEELFFDSYQNMSLDDYDDDAIGLNIGFGLNYFAFEHFAFCADARYYWGEADFDLDNDLDVGGFRFSGGFKVAFGK